MRSKVTASFVLAALLSVLGVGTLVLVLRPGPDRAPEATGPPADVARIVCASSDAARVETPIVRAHRDGVHLLFENPDHATQFELRAQSWQYGTTVGGDLPTGATSETFTLPPGKVTVSCLVGVVDPGASAATLTIVDPDGLWVATDLTCARAEQLRLQVNARAHEEPADVFRRVSGVKASDGLRKPGYPESPWHWPTLLVFRDGAAVGRIGAPRMGDQWELLVDACPGSEIVGA
jgi:hypothetical protein